MSRIRIKHFENEIELEGDDDFIQHHLDDFYKKIVSMPIKKNTLDIDEPPNLSDIYISEKGVAPAEFFNKFTQKNKTEGINQILIFGKYLEIFAEKAEFSKKEINDIVKQAKLPKDIHGQYFTNAVKQGLLRNNGKGKYSLTLSAETAFSSIQ
jgi:hypothetical protein